MAGFPPFLLPFKQNSANISILVNGLPTGKLTKKILQQRYAVLQNSGELTSSPEIIIVIIGTFFKRTPPMLHRAKMYDSRSIQIQDHRKRR